ncbi:glycosyltransferase [Haliea sp. E17]|uniref:glycosyltransferase n=1 Tax=Haliea sp. E17 TaxID=3401576 RepID=UPI003AAA58B8
MAPVIVIIAYNRPDSLKRLLNSMSHAAIPTGTPLVISVDFSGNDEVPTLAEDFSWPQGEKRVIVHQENLGLRKHVLSCGDFAVEYGSAILLEDDLYISPHFYSYAKTALAFYESEAKIAGVSLYNHQWNETARQKFSALDLTSSSCYLLQIASSWGQCWTAEQWTGFRTWYEQNSVWADEEMIPHNVSQWPETSWKKYFIRYLIANDLYFLYPKKSYSTNFSDVGIHHKEKHSVLQVPLQMQDQELRLLPFEQIREKYDAFCELSPQTLQELQPTLKQFDLEVDLYGVKPSEKIKRSHLLTSKVCTRPVLSFGMELKPHEVNVVMNNPGGEFCVGLREDCLKQNSIAFVEQSRYYFDIHRSYDDVLLREHGDYKNRYLALEKKLRLPLLRRIKRGVKKLIGKQ